MRLGSVLPLTHFSTWRSADPIQRARIRVLVEQVPCNTKNNNKTKSPCIQVVCKGFGVLRCDAESSAEEVECSGGVTYYVGYVGAPS